MAIFSRRVLQHMLEANAVFLPAEATARHVAGLNAATGQSLDTEWEVAVLYGLAQLGTVAHERPVRGGRKPDVHFRSRRGAFVGDVVTVSDAGVIKRNPWPQFQRELMRVVHAARLDGNRFDVLVDTRVEGSGRSQHVVLALPPAAQMHEVIEREFGAFLRAVQGAPDRPHEQGYHAPGVAVTLRYDPASPYFSAGFRTYDLPQSVTHNPLYLALKRKADQLRGLPPTTVVFACDGGSRSLRTPRSGVETVSTPQIISRFFREHRLSAVCLLTVEDRTRVPLQPLQPPVLRSAVYFNPQLRRQTWLEETLAAVAAGLPAPERRAENALNLLDVPDRRHTGTSFWGGYTVTDNTIRLSARGVLDLLAGNITKERFQQAHGFVPHLGRRAINPLAAFAAQGRLITGARLERVEQEDDDWLVLEFGEPDPAVSRFRVPTVAPKR